MSTLKYSVIANFIDKNTQVYYPEGSFFETKSKGRANELQSGGFLVEEIKTTVEQQKAQVKQGEQDESSEV